MNNSDFNILNQLTQEQKSLWRIQKHYIEEAQSEEEKNAWKELESQKQQTIEKLKTMAKTCI